MQLLKTSSFNCSSPEKFVPPDNPDSEVFIAWLMYLIAEEI